jgi:hypothetical protein
LLVGTHQSRANAPGASTRPEALGFLLNIKLHVKEWRMEQLDLHLGCMV